MKLTIGPYQRPTLKTILDCPLCAELFSSFEAESPVSVYSVTLISILFVGVYTSIMLIMHGNL